MRADERREPLADGGATDADGEPTSTDGEATSTDGEATGTAGGATSTDGRATGTAGGATDGRVGATRQAAGPPAPGAAPALRRGLAVLRLLASRATPVSAGAIARELGLPRSTTYELLTELAAAGFAVHLPTERRWGLGLVAFEIGSAYLRGEPLERAGRPVLARLCVRAAATAHLGVLHGAQTLYLAKDKAGLGSPTLVTEVGVRLPAALTATGLSILAHLPAEQVRALFPDRMAFVDRTGRGPDSLPALRRDLAAVRRRGWAIEDGRVSAGTASVAAPVFDHNTVPIAAVGVTIAHRCSAADERGCDQDFAELAGLVRRSAHDVTMAIGGRELS